MLSLCWQFEGQLSNREMVDTLMHLNSLSAMKNTGIQAINIHSSLCSNIVLSNLQLYVNIEKKNQKIGFHEYSCSNNRHPPPP